MHIKQFGSFYLMLLRQITKNLCQHLENNQPDPQKPVPITANLNTIKFVLSGAERRKEKGGGSLQPGYNTCEQVQEERHSFTRKWGWEPILPEGSEKTE